jgi:hypothetical protein
MRFINNPMTGKKTTQGTKLKNSGPLDATSLKNIGFSLLLRYSSLRKWFFEGIHFPSVFYGCN